MTDLDTLYNELEIHLSEMNINIGEYVGCCIDAIISINNGDEDFEIIYQNGDIKIPYEVIDEFNLFKFVESYDMEQEIEDNKESLENHIFINCLENDEEITRLIKNYMSTLTPMEILDELSQYEYGREYPRKSS